MPTANAISERELVRSSAGFSSLLGSVGEWRVRMPALIAGGNLLVNASDNSWFRLSILSDQMVSFSVLRAVENHRSFVFAAALGPSTIIDSCGRILKQAGREQEASISCEVPVENDLTPFTRWCF